MWLVDCCIYGNTAIRIRWNLPVVNFASAGALSIVDLPSWICHSTQGLPARLHFIGCVFFVDSVRRTTCSHVGFAAPVKKAKCSSFKSQLLFTFATPKIPGGCAITSLPQIYSVTWWISFLRLSGIIFSGIYHSSAQWNISFFGSVDIFSSDQWINLLRLIGFFFIGFIL